MRISILLLVYTLSSISFSASAESDYFIQKHANLSAGYNNFIEKISPLLDALSYEGAKRQRMDLLQKLKEQYHAAMECFLNEHRILLEEKMPTIEFFEKSRLINLVRRFIEDAANMEILMEYYEQNEKSK